MPLSKPARITYEAHGIKHIVELPTSEITLEEYYDYCKGLAILAGFNQESVNELFDE